MADMTDAERTSANAEEQEQTTTTGGLFGKIVETAKNMVETVTETAKDVVEAVAERTPPAVATAVGTAGHAASAVVDRVRNTGEPQAANAPAETPVSQASEAPVEASESETPQEQPVVSNEQPAEVAGESQGVLAEAASAAADAASTVTQRIARVYDAIVGTESQASAPATTEASAAEGQPEGGQDAGASYTPPADGSAKPGGRPRRFKDVQPGMQLQGKVTSIALYGIFVDVGVGRDGLVHISEMSDKRVESPTDIVEIGTPVDVWVKSVDPDARRISLTMRDPNRPKPERTERRAPRKREINRERLAEMKPGDTIEGVISSLAPFGAFVDLGVGKDGLVHVSELAEGRVERPEDAVQVGERYTFKVLEVDPEGNRISLSLRRAQRTQRMQQLEPGTIMDGTISGIAAFGAFVDVGVGRDGLVHVSEISAERINSVEEALTVGDKVQVKVIEVDPNSKRISLTMRVEEPLPSERPRPAPRAAGAPGFRSEPAAGFTPAPSFPAAPAFGGLPPMEEGRGDRRGGGRRVGGSREGGRETGGRSDFGRGETGRAGGGRRDRDRGESRGPGRSEGTRGRREGQIFEPSQEVYTFEDPEEETFTGDATLEDLLSKFNSGKGRDRKQSREEEDEENQKGGRADAIRRTLALRDEE
jgi:predicted RNA-binding protein with RPS1 domain